MKTEDIEAVGR